VAGPILAPGLMFLKRKNHLIDPEKCFEQFREAGCFIAYGHATAMNLPEFLQFSPQ